MIPDWLGDVVSDAISTEPPVGLAAALFALLALALLEMPTSEEERLMFDPLRVVEAITAGVAFLAAGSILSHGGRVEGLTTGAGLWLAGAVGFGCGIGQLGLAAISTVLAVIVLAVLRNVWGRGATEEDR